MASTIAAVTTSGGGVVTTADASGNLNLLAGTTTVVALTTSGAAVTGTLSNTTGATFATSSGNVLIGTTSNAPGSRLVSVGGGIQLSGGTTAQAGVRVQVASGVATFTGINNDNNAYNPLAFYTSATEAVRIDSSGAVFIGCTAVPSASVEGRRLELGSGATTSSSGSSTAAYSHWTFINGNGAVGNIQTNASATSYNTSSDYRLKTTITPMVGALAKVAALKPVTYKWKVDGSDGQGFIAHELQEVVAGCVTGEKDATREEEYEVTPAVPAVVDAEGVETTPAIQAVKATRTVPSYQGIDTSFLVATLTAAIQELKAIIDAQATRIAALEAK